MRKTLYLLLLVIFILTSCNKKEINSFTNSTNSKVSTNSNTSTANSTSTTANSTSTTANSNEISKSEDVDMNSNKDNTESLYNEKIKKEHDSIMAKVTDDTFDNVITKIMPQSIGNYLMYTFDPIKSYQVTPINFDHDYKIEIIRKVNNQRMYSIHKTDSNGLFYSFFEGTNVSDGSWLYNTVYSCKKLTKSDFNNIKIGDAISKIEQINPGTTLWSDLAQKNELESFEESVLLTDGLLLISYNKGSNSMYCVTDIQYHEDFKITKTFTNIGEIVYDYSILLQDYPN